MKVTRDKTQSVDLGNGITLHQNGEVRFSTDGNLAAVFYVGDTGWAEEILAKHFTPITITIETEDEACTLWHYLNSSNSIVKSKQPDVAQPNTWQDGHMWSALDNVYNPEGAK